MRNTPPAAHPHLATRWPTSASLARRAPASHAAVRLSGILLPLRARRMSGRRARPTASGSPGTSRRPKCRSRPKSAAASSSSPSTRATASTAGDVIARLDTRDTELALQRRAGRPRAGRRAAAPAARRVSQPKTCSQAVAQSQAAARRHRCRRSRSRVAQTRISSATKRCSARTPAPASSATMPRRGGTWRGARLNARRERATRRQETLARVKAGARPQEIEAGRRAARRRSTRRLRTLEKQITDATRHRAGRRARHREARGHAAS